MTTISVGRKVQDFAIQTTGGDFRLSDQRSGNVVIYFHPRDDTPGCTLEGSDFRSRSVPTMTMPSRHDSRSGSGRTCTAAR